MNSLTTPGSLKSLDGLRAMAILLVLMTHISQYIPGLSFVHYNMEWATPLYNGWIGVDLFFVLSGFLVGSTVIKHLNQQTFSIHSFFLSRFFRIIPAYLAVIFVILLLKETLPANWQTILPLFGKKAVATNIFLLTDYLPGYIGIPSWSLSIEEHFYLLLPFFLLLVRKFETRVYTTLALIALALLFRMVTYRVYGIGEATPMAIVFKYIYFPFHDRMDSLAMGVLIALIHHHTQNVQNIYRTIIGSFGLLLVGFVCLCGELKGGFYNTTIQYTLVNLGFGSLLWSVLGIQLKEQSKAQSFLSAPIFVPIARISYSVYLTHLLVLSILSHFILFKLWMFPFILASCLLAALPLYLLIEYPCHQFARKRFAPAPKHDLAYAQ
ncbi:MAG: acyltransferase [Gammaproteobacteria bacterium]|nr:acyltransferase [Gammaproteobacteria bacterium]